MRIVAISDTHEQHDQLTIPDGDVLIHAGDITWKGSLNAIKKFAEWLQALPHKHKVIIAGNHDWCFEKSNQAIIASEYLRHITYLKDSNVNIDGYNFYGSPWQPEFCDWAFNLPRGGSAIKATWDLIPYNTDVLITHGPPYGFGDMTPRGEPVGCEDLLARVLVIKPKVHIFGHIHAGYGISSNEDTAFINASICNENYKPVNAPIVYDL